MKVKTLTDWVLHAELLWLIEQPVQLQNESKSNDARASLRVSERVNWGALSDNECLIVVAKYENLFERKLMLWEEMLTEE